MCKEVDEYETASGANDPQSSLPAPRSKSQSQENRNSLIMFQSSPDSKIISPAQEPLPVEDFSTSSNLSSPDFDDSSM